MTARTLTTSGVRKLSTLPCFLVAASIGAASLCLDQVALAQDDGGYCQRYCQQYGQQVGQQYCMDYCRTQVRPASAPRHRLSWEFDTVSMLLFGGVGYGFGSFVCGAPEVGILMGPSFRACADGCRNGNSFFGTSLAPEIGFIYHGFLHDDIEHNAYEGVIGFRARRLFGVVGFGATAHLHFGAVDVDLGDRSEQRFAMGARSGIEAFIFHGLIGLELVYHWTTDFTDLNIHSFEGLIYIDPIVIAETIFL